MVAAALCPFPDLCLLLRQLRTREGSEFLIQHDSEQIITAWHKAIADSIGRRVSRVPHPAATLGPGPGVSRCPFLRAPTSPERRRPIFGLNSAPGRSWEAARRGGQVSTGTRDRHKTTHPAGPRGGPSRDTPVGPSGWC